MNDYRLVRSVAMMIVMPLLAGCFKLSRETPPVQYFVLGGRTAASGDGGTLAVAPNAVPPSSSSAATDGASSMPNAKRLAVGLRRLDLASYLAVPAIVMRRDANQITVSEFQRWGEELGDGINRVVAARLARTPPVSSVDVAPWEIRAPHDFLVQLHVTRFEGEAAPGATEGRSHLAADWDIVRPLDGRVLVRGRTEGTSAPWRVGDYAALVRGLDAALTTVAHDIGGCLARFPNDSTPPAACGSVGSPSR